MTSAINIRKVLTAGVVATLAFASPDAQSSQQPMTVRGLTGTLRIQQGIPCGGTIDRTTPVTGGRIELTPSEGVPVGGGSRAFALTRADVSFASFSLSGSCAGISETQNYGPVYVQLTRSVGFTATPTPTPGLFGIVIPRGDVMITHRTTVNGAEDTGVRQPREDVTGTLDLNTGAVQMRVVLGTRVTFRAGCIADACIIDETHDGTITASLNGTIQFPDADADGVPDRTDNCRFVANPDQSIVPSPALSAPPDVTLASCTSRAFGFAAAADVCEARPVTVTSDAPTIFTVGPTTVTWRAQDSDGTVVTDTQVVTVVDTTAPAFTFVPPDIELNDCGSPSLGTPAAADDCAGTPTFTNDGPSIFYVGTTPVTWTARDASGNTSTAVQHVTVVDTTPPSVSCSAVSPIGNSFRVSSTDACAGAPTLRLGDFTLQEGEVVKINVTGQPGVRLVNTARDGEIRHFQVGRGEAVITATDASGNTASATCTVR